MYTIFLIILILLFVLMSKILLKSAEKYDESNADEAMEPFIYALSVFLILLIIAIAVFVILDIRSLIIIKEYPSYESKIVTLNEDNKKIDKSMKAILLSVKPEILDDAKEKDINLDGTYVDAVSSLDCSSSQRYISDLITRYAENCKKISKIEKKKNNISQYKMNVFPLWK